LAETDVISFVPSQPENVVEMLPERFLSYIFHELRTPLTVVHSYAQIALDKLPVGPENDNLRRILNRMVNQGEETVEMIEELLEASRIPLGHLNLDKTVIELTTLIEGAIEYLPDELHSYVKIFSPTKLHPILADPPRLQRVFNTLFKFTLSEQQARGLSPDLQIVYATDISAAKVKLNLNAVGLVMDTIQQQNLFDLYRPMREDTKILSKAGFLDIGLYVAKGIIEAHQGHLDYSLDLPGFSIELPLVISA
jgi:signal transduction histidine kinase